MYRWVTLWSGQPQCHSIAKESRIFSPELKKIDFATKCDNYNDYHSVLCL